MRVFLSIALAFATAAYADENDWRVPFITTPGDVVERMLELAGTRIVSHSFRMASWRPDRMETVRVAQPHPGQGDESTLYLWIVPAEVRGTWIGGGRRVRIEQNYQEIDVDGAAEARLSGSDISWRSPQGRFRGRVQGERIVGEDGLVLTRER